MARPAAARIASISLILVFGMRSEWAEACPFCGVVGQSLAMRRDAADIVAIGTAQGAAAPGTAGFLEQAFTIDQTLRGSVPADGTDIMARVDGPVTGTALLCGMRPERGLRWSAIAANEAVLGYAVAAPATSLPAAERLRWFVPRLEHPEPAIAADAFTECGLAPFDAVCEAADAFDPKVLAAWVGEPGIDARRRGFYGLAAGIVAARTHDATVRRNLLAALRTAIVAPADDFRAGFDGLLAGLLVAEGPSAIDEFSRLGLFRETARPVDQRHLLTALRFASESLGTDIPRERVAAATAQLLASPAVAADATVDLARYQAWEPIDAVADLWTKLGRDDPIIRRAVAGYLDACPLPTARTYLARLRAADPKRLEAALEAARLPLARP